MAGVGSEEGEGGGGMVGSGSTNKAGIFKNVSLATALRSAMSTSSSSSYVEGEGEAGPEIKHSNSAISAILRGTR